MEVPAIPLGAGHAFDGRRARGSSGPGALVVLTRPTLFLSATGVVAVVRHP